jgi:hypothetical protein
MKNNIPLFKVFMSDSVTEKVSEVLKSGFIGQGPVVENFEEAIEDAKSPIKSSNGSGRKISNENISSIINNITIHAKSNLKFPT